MGVAKDPLVGLRVQIGIDEDGAPHPPALPAGTISKKLPGPGDQYVVQLDKPVSYYRLDYKGEVKRDWTLSELMICARHVGHPLDLLIIKESHVAFHNDVIVNIANHQTGEYFAIGGVRKAE
jgi:hypothetical protein